MTFKGIEEDTLENILEEASHCAALHKVQQPDVMIHQEAIKLMILMMRNQPGTSQAQVGQEDLESLGQI